MSQQYRKMCEAIKTAHYMRQVLFKESALDEYQRGVYNGFELLCAILESREPKIKSRLELDIIEDMVEELK
jgi:hypothetical protein